LDRIALKKVLEKINAEDRLAPEAVKKVIPQMEKAARLLARAHMAGRRIIFIGAGTSGRLGVLEAAECPPTFGVSPSKTIGIMAGGKSAVFRSKEGAEDDALAGARDALKQISRGDAVVGIAASGITAYVRGALSAAKKAGCATILVTCNDKMRVESADVIIAPVVGPEALSGSTRMKSGTAAKLVLNSLTTSAMVLAGKVYKNWMVDLRPSSKKLTARAERITAVIAGISPEKAGNLLKHTNYNVKTAIVMSRLGLTKKEASEKIKQSGGILRKILE